MNRALEMQVETTYEDAGVDTDQGSIALKGLTDRLRGTWPSKGEAASVQLDFGYFANVIDIGQGIGLAVCTDGVGSKALIAQMMEKYDTIGIDCVAMNVNDLVCVGAKPLSLVDYVAVEKVDPAFMDALGIGLERGAQLAGISISGGEIAELRDMIRGQPPGRGFDLAGTAVGIVDLDKLLAGQAIEEGDIVIGVESNGIHSNGLTLVRHVLFKKHNFDCSTRFSDLTTTLGEELLKPTHIYVKEALDVLNQGICVKALVHITSDGLLNLTRVQSRFGYVIEELPEFPQIFTIIQRYGKIGMQKMFSVFNMGIGFCYVVSPKDSDRVLAILDSHGRRAYKIGYASQAEPETVSIPKHGLKGKDKTFWQSDG